MRKIGLILAGAVLFDLGTVVATSHAAAIDFFLKLDGVSAPASAEYLKIKLSKVNTADACTMSGGTVFRSGPDSFCTVRNPKFSASGPGHTVGLANTHTSGGTSGGPH